MNRQSLAARTVAEAIETPVLLVQDLQAANDNDADSFDALAHDVVALLMRHGRAMLSGEHSLAN